VVRIVDLKEILKARRRSKWQSEMVAVLRRTMGDRHRAHIHRQTDRQTTDTVQCRWVHCSAERLVTRRSHGIHKTQSDLKADDTQSRNRRRLLDCVSYRSGTRFFWYQILAPVGCVFYFVPISGMHVTTTATGDWSMPLFSFCLYSLVILLFVFSVQ